MLVGALVVGVIAIAVIGLMVSGGSKATATATPTVTAQKPAESKPAASNSTAAAPAAKPAEAAPAKPAAKAEAKASTLGKIGDRVESGGVALTVVGVDRTDSMGQFFKAKPGRTYAVVEVVLETTGRDKAPYNPMYFKVKDSEGVEYTAGLAGGDDSLKAGELEQGDKVRGTVAFDVPADAKGLTLSYQPIVIFGGYQTIRVALG